MSKISFFDSVSPRFFDEYLFLDGISEKFGYQRYKIVGCLAETSSYKVSKTPPNDSRFFITVVKIISYVSVILPLLAIACKIFDRSLHNYQATLGFGTSSLEQSVNNYLWKFPDRDTCAFGVINTYFREKNCKDLSELFPERTVTAEEVRALSVQQLLALSSCDYMATLDLMSGEQALEIFKSQCPANRKLPLYFYSRDFRKLYGLQLRRLTTLPLDPAVQAAAQKALETQVKVSQEGMKKLQTEEKYSLLDRARQQTSNSLAPDYLRKAWEAMNRGLLPEGLKPPLTAQFLQDLNEGLRPVNPREEHLAPEVRSEQLYFRFREFRDEVCTPNMETCFLPGAQVVEEMENFIKWLNLELEACDQGTKNPIVVAALAFQLFISIHPFQNGNGRTGRLLADLILRRYQLLPAVWGKDSDTFDLTLFIHLPERKNSPDIAVTTMLKALETSSQQIAS